jgi:tetratricopeptide (TPR) repeat protein
VEETFLSRFDALDVRVRKVLQTCAVWGLSFELKDIVQVHTELEEADIESALETAVEEMILIENEEDNGDGVASVTSRGSGSSSVSETLDHRGSDQIMNAKGRFFQFSHAIWRSNVLATMLRGRKVEIHRLIAESMERDEVMILEESDISKLLTLFDHWKACGDFGKTAPLALVVGARLEEWELSAQSLELYQDALEMVMGGVETADTDGAAPTKSPEWVRVKAKPVVLDLILRLHVCAGLCHQKLNDDKEGILFFEDAYNIIRTASKLSGITQVLKMPIISSLCVLKMELSEQDLADTTEDIGDLIMDFVTTAKSQGSQIHIGRALAMLASYHVRNQDLELALEVTNELVNTYDIAEHHETMIDEYGRDFAMECVAESAQWLYLLGKLEEATQRADSAAAEFLEATDDVDGLMYILFPLLQVLCLAGRAQTAQHLFQTHAIDPCRDASEICDYWDDLFEPISLLIRLIRLDETGQQINESLLRKIEMFVFQDEVTFDSELDRRGKTLAGELCWRVAKAFPSSQQRWVEKAREFLVPVARYEHDELFQKQAAQALLDSL